MTQGLQVQVHLSERCEQTRPYSLALLHKFASCLLTPCS